MPGSFDAWVSRVCLNFENSQNLFSIIVSLDSFTLLFVGVFFKSTSQARCLSKKNDKLRSKSNFFILKTVICHEDVSLFCFKSVASS